MRAACCWWQQRTPSAIRRWCGARRRGWALRSQLRTRSNRKSCWRCPPGCCSVIRWFARRSTERPDRMSDARSTVRSRKQLMPEPTPTGASGTGRGLRPYPMRTSPRNWSVRQPGPRHVVDSQPPRRSASARSHLRPRPGGGPSARSPPRKRTCRPAPSLRLCNCWPAQSLGCWTSWDVLTLSCCVARSTFASSAGSEAPALLLKAARGIEPLDIDARARDISGCPGSAAFFAGGFARVGTLQEISRAARSAPQPTAAPRPADLLLDALSVLVTRGTGRGGAHVAPGTQRPCRGAKSRSQKELRWGWLATHVAWALWDDQSWHQAVGRHLQTVREAGLLDNPAGLSPNSRSQCGVAWRFCDCCFADRRG